MQKELFFPQRKAKVYGSSHSILFAKKDVQVQFIEFQFLSLIFVFDIGESCRFLGNYENSYKSKYYNTASCRV